MNNLYFNENWIFYDYMLSGSKNEFNSHATVKIYRGCL